MGVAFFLAPWILLGIAVVFVAFSGGPGRARENYLTRGNRGVKLLAPIGFVLLVLVVPGIIIASRGEALGGTGKLAVTSPSSDQERGKQLFNANCKSCHTLKAAEAYGVTGPSLDELGALDEGRVIAAIRNGGTGKDLMPAGILQGRDAESVAKYVSAVAGQ